jgi:hypothetical protein
LQEIGRFRVNGWKVLREARTVNGRFKGTAVQESLVGIVAALYMFSPARDCLPASGFGLRKLKEGV